MDKEWKTVGSRWERWSKSLQTHSETIQQSQRRCLTKVPQGVSKCFCVVAGKLCAATLCAVRELCMIINLPSMGQFHKLSFLVLLPNTAPVVYIRYLHTCLFLCSHCDHPQPENGSTHRPVHHFFYSSVHSHQRRHWCSLCLCGHTSVSQSDEWPGIPSCSLWVEFSSTIRLHVCITISVFLSSDHM